MLDNRRNLKKYNLGNSYLEKDFKTKYKRYKALSKKLSVKIYYEENYNKKVRYIVELRVAGEEVKKALQLLNVHRQSLGLRPVLMDNYFCIL